MLWDVVGCRITMQRVTCHSRLFDRQWIHGSTSVQVHFPGRDCFLVRLDRPSSSIRLSQYSGKQIMLQIMSEMQKRYFISPELTRIMLYQTRNSEVFLSSISYKVVWHIINVLHTDIERRHCHKHMILHNGISPFYTGDFGTHFVNVLFMFLPDRWTFVKSERNIYTYINNVFYVKTVIRP